MCNLVDPLDSSNFALINFPINHFKLRPAMLRIYDSTLERSKSKMPPVITIECTRW